MCLCRQIEHRHASLVVKYGGLLAGHRGTEPQAKREARWAVTYQESSCIDVRAKRECRQCVSRKTVEVDSSSCMLCYAIQRLITAASHMRKRLKLLGNSTNCSCMYKD